VFISSASGALLPYRSAAVAVCRRLGMTPVHMEEFDPGRPPPVDVCRREVQSCDVLVLLLAHRYGCRPAGHDVSYTELEYRWAVGDEAVAVLPFVVDPAFPWPPGEVDRGDDEEALAAFLATVQTQHVVGTFGDVTRFREDLLVALHRVDLQERRTSTPAVAPSPAAPAFHAVPAYSGGGPFTGRVEQLDTLDAWAESDDPIMVVEAIGGTGKSALTWHWTTTRAPGVIDDLAGRLWWSFYDGSASITRFLQEVLGYATGYRRDEFDRMGHTELSAAVLAELRARPYLLVLDGVERLLAAYQRLDSSRLRDEDVVVAQRSLIEPHAYDVLCALATPHRSRVLISTRLVPDALEGRFGGRLPGVRHVRLPGLTDDETLTLTARLGIRGTPRAITDFLGHLGNHPLLIGLVAGLVHDHRPAPGDFDRWRADPHAGGAFDLTTLDLSQRRSHILAAALAGIHPGPRVLLGWISVLPGTVDWTTLRAINPFRDEASDPDDGADARLDRALADLEDRGLLWWDRTSNTYDLHPIVRAVAHQQLDAEDRVRANNRISAHFEALPPAYVDRPRSVDDLRNAITLFRALVAADRFRKAANVWHTTLYGPLLFELGGTATAIALLTPLAEAGLPNCRTELAFAFYQAERHRDALKQDLAVLADDLAAGYAYKLQEDIENTVDDFLGLDQDANATRYLALWDGFVKHKYHAGKLRQRGILAAKHGRAAEARALLATAARLGPLPGTVWFEADVRWWPLYLDLHEGTLTEPRLDAADAVADTWLERRNLRRLRRDLLVRHGEFGHALDVARDCDRMDRDSGVEVVPAAVAFLLAAVGHVDEAARAVEDALEQSSRVDEAARPYHYLAGALIELGRTAEAAGHARAAYRQAWGDGPPFCQHWNLARATHLLDRLGLQPPDLPTLDMSTWQAPLEPEIRRLIAQTRQRQGR
jgi:tetratricopeptide (TPR) repeat protein